MSKTEKFLQAIRSGTYNGPIQVREKVSLAAFGIVTCCKCGHRGKKFECKECKHKICGSCK